MGIFDYFRKKKIDNIVDAVKKKNIGKRYLMLLLGCLIVAFSFNLFFLRYDIVCFGVSGISIVGSVCGCEGNSFYAGFEKQKELTLMNTLQIRKEAIDVMNKLRGTVEERS